MNSLAKKGAQPPVANVVLWSGSRAALSMAKFTLGKNFVAFVGSSVCFWRVEFFVAIVEQPRSYYWSEASFFRQLIGSVHIRSIYFSESWPIEESKTPIKIKGR